MGSRITFRERTNGVCVQGIVASPAIPPVSIAEPRVKYIRGWKSTENGGDGDPADESPECGPGSKYPIKVTPDQLAELSYRVRDCKIGEESGDRLIYTWDDSVAAYHSRWVESNGLSQTTNFIENEEPADPEDPPDWGAAFTVRSYALIIYNAVSAPSIDTAREDFYSTNYVSGVQATHYAWYDLLENENFMWHSVLKEYPPGIDYFDYSAGCGMNFYQISTGSQPTIHALDVFDGDGHGHDTDTDNVMFSVHFSGSVAYYNTDSTKGPFDAGSELYVGLVVNIDVMPMVPSSDSAYADYFGFSLSTDKASDYVSDIGQDGVDSGSTFRLRLSNATEILECPFYRYDYGPFDSGYFESWSGRIVIEATKWYPYADNTGAPVWDANTGSLL